MTKSVEEQHAEAEAALSAVECNGQRNAMGERELWRADHSLLATRVDKLERRVRREACGGVHVTRVDPTQLKWSALWYGF
ncbi:hypothetical protein WYO_0381 [Methylobacterium sp. GXF4]|uniref:Uncharacterized protein n=1 Tax=Methylobacterium brachiatum TaxID=269660 RepID=A0ABV1R1F9_9HYPH|nr:hypothetical protein [Methylobacterium sp. GXF4]EIZ86925.1 hypothetical protein WYO_0381 [Methylobacterium sp. GXF4]